MGVKDSLLNKLLGNAAKFSDEQITQTVDLLIQSAIKHRATDIHIEPHENYTSVRFRIDNNLRSMHKLPLAALSNLARQIKVMAYLNAEEDQLPQEGRFAFLVDNNEFELQASTMPVYGGEKVVLHISQRLSKPPTLIDLGFWGQNLQDLQLALASQHGLVVAAIPRRSGKTTTLHSMLQFVNSPLRSLATVEDNIEYRIPGVSQLRAKPHQGITFERGFAAALNQDPNVIMVSNLADKATADLAVQSAVNGHQIISGVNATSAVRGLSHLRSLSSEPFLLVSALRCVVSQRLVRKLCVHCREHYAPDADELAEIAQAFELDTAATKKTLHELEKRAVTAGLSHKTNTTPTQIIALWRANEHGCEACNHTGYSGSIAVTEVLNITEKLQKAVLNHETPAQIQKLAMSQNFVPMAWDGVIKALCGQTSIVELLRMTVV